MSDWTGAKDPAGVWRNQPEERLAVSLETDCEPADGGTVFQHPFAGVRKRAFTSLTFFAGRMAIFFISRHPCGSPAARRITVK